jgi:heme/copper-type cytochrome/quinol oxidase subunit 2
VRNLLIGAAALAVAVVLFLVLRPDDVDEKPLTLPETTTTGTTTTVTVTVPQPPPGPPPPANVRVTIRDGLPVGGVRRVTVARGRRVVLLVTSDVADHVHLHGYDVMRDVGPGAPARLQFRATIPGRFEVELEDAGLQIADVTVRP